MLKKQLQMIREIFFYQTISANNVVRLIELAHQHPAKTLSQATIINGL